MAFTHCFRLSVTERNHKRHDNSRSSDSANVRNIMLGLNVKSSNVSTNSHIRGRLPSDAMMLVSVIVTLSDTSPPRR